MFNQYPYYVLARKEEKEKYGKICSRTRPRPAELVLILLNFWDFSPIFSFSLDIMLILCYYIHVGGGKLNLLIWSVLFSCCFVTDIFPLNLPN